MKRGPQRIVCLTEETTETLYLLGEEDRIVGISSFTRRPARALREKPKVSQFIRADTDEIEALEPDLVLGFSDLQADIAAELARRGLEVWLLNHRSVAGILAMIRNLARLVDRAEAGETLAAKLEAGIAAARSAAEGLARRPRVYFEEWPDPIITGIRWVSELIEIAGGVDCFADLREASLGRDRIVEAREVRRREPDLYLACWCGKRFDAAEAMAREGFADAPFCREGRMLELPAEVMLQPGPAALGDGLELLVREVHRVAAELADLP